MRPRLVAQQSSWMRARDLTPPESVTGPPGAGPSAALYGPPSSPVILALAAAMAAAGALQALRHFALAGFLIFGVLSAACGYASFVQWRQSRAPSVLVGPGGVWLAGTDREPGRAIAWAEVAELVFCTVTERRVFDPRSQVRARPHPALAVRLADPPPLSEQDRQQVEQLSAPVPALRDTLLTSLTTFLALPYRRVARSAASQAPALAEVVHRYAPQVSVVEGPPVELDMAWRPGSDTALPPGLLGEAVRSPLERLGVVDPTDTRP